MVRHNAQGWKSSAGALQANRREGTDPHSIRRLESENQWAIIPHNANRWGYSDMVGAAYFTSERRTRRRMREHVHQSLVSLAGYESEVLPGVEQHVRRVHDSYGESKR